MHSFTFLLSHVDMDEAYNLIDKELLKNHMKHPIPWIFIGIIFPLRRELILSLYEQ